MRRKCVGAFLLLAAFAVAGCHRGPKRTPIAAIPPAPLPSPSPAPVPPPPPSPAPPPAPVSPLEQPDRAFASGNYDEAARGYENYLRMTTSGAQREQALFYLALAYALRPAPATDWPRATATLRQLIEEYPDGPLKAQANIILTLRAELDQVTSDIRQRELRLKQLTTELDRLKKIDADRRKRP
jgi:Tetratricopeptide repeat